MTRDRLALAAILIFAAVLRLYGLPHGLPFVYNPDEANIMARALSVARGLDPEYYLYPSFFFYFLFAVMGGLFALGRISGRYPSLSAFETRFFEDPTDFYLAGRVAVVVLSIATLWLVARLVSKRFGRLAGCSAALFGAVAYFHVRDSHYLKHDVPAGFLVASSLWAMDRAMERKTARSYLLAGAILGVSFATHYYLIFLAPAFALCHLAHRGRRDFARVLQAGAISALTFVLLSPFVVLRFPTALEHMRANREVVIDRSLAGASAFFPSIPLYLEFLVEQGLGYVLLVLVLAGFVVMARRSREDFVLFGAFPLLFLLFIGYTFFAGRYLNPLLPPLAAAAGAAVGAVGARFGNAAALTLALAACAQPLFHSLQADRLFASEDTRTLARAWAIENLSADTAIALQSYSVPLPQSASSFRESLKANGALAELDRRGKYAHLLAIAEREEKSFPLVFLGRGDERNRTYVSYDQLASGLEPLRAHGVGTVVLRVPPIQPPGEVQAVFERVRREGTLLSRFPPFRGEPVTPYLDNEDWPPSPALVYRGPVIEIWSIETVPSSAARRPPL